MEWSSTAPYIIRHNRPPWTRNCIEDFTDACVGLFIHFIGSLILWPFVIIVSLLVLPLVYGTRVLLMKCYLPCQCSNTSLYCVCRELVSYQERGWLVYEKMHMSLSQFRDLSNSHNTKQPVKRRVNLSSISIEVDRDNSEHLDPLMDEEVGTSSTHPYTAMSINTDEMESAQAYSSSYQHVHTVVISIKKGLTANSICDTLTNKLVNERDRRHRRFMQCLVELPGGCLAWAHDPHFQIHQHIGVLSNSVQNQPELEAVLRYLNKQGLDYQAPLWHVTIIPEFDAFREMVLIWRFHSSVMDGVSISAVLTKLFSDVTIISRKSYSHFNHYHDHTVKFLLTGPVRFLHMLLTPSQRNTDQTDIKQYSDFGWSERTITHSQLLKNNILLNTTINDVLIGLISGAALITTNPERKSETNKTSYDKSVLPDQQMVLVTVNTWTKLFTGENIKNNVLLLSIPFKKCQELIPRIWRASYALTQIKQEGDIYINDKCFKWIHYLPLPHSVIKCILNKSRKNCQLLISSLYGPPAVVSINGCSVTDIMYYSALPGSLETSFNLITYSGAIKLCVQTNRHLDNLSEEVDQIVKYMCSQMKDVDQMVFKKYFPDGLVKRNKMRGTIPIDREVYEFLQELHELESRGSTLSKTDFELIKPHSRTSSSNQQRASQNSSSLHQKRSSSESPRRQRLNTEGAPRQRSHSESLPSHPQRSSDASSEYFDTVPGQTSSVKQKLSTQRNITNQLESENKISENTFPNVIVDQSNEDRPLDAEIIPVKPVDQINLAPSAALSNDAQNSPTVSSLLP